MQNALACSCIIDLKAWGKQKGDQVFNLPMTRLVFKLIWPIAAWIFISFLFYPKVWWRWNWDLKRQYFFKKKKNVVRIWNNFLFIIQEDHRDPTNTCACAVRLVQKIKHLTWLGDFLKNRQFWPFLLLLHAVPEPLFNAWWSV